MEKIPMTDLNAQYQSIKGEIDRAIQEVIDSSGFILGKQVSLLEEEISKYLSVKFAVGVASGTDALVLALIAAGIGPGDEVITTPFTFIATAEAICRSRAKPVFCDIEYGSYNIDPEKLKARITKKTKAIIPVHLYGLPCDLARLSSLAKEHGLKMIEDCAQSFGSEYEGRKVGGFGDCGVFSFFPAKTLGAFGDGGMVVTDDAETCEKIKILRNHGSKNKYYYEGHGFNSRLDTLQAAILRVKLKYADNWIAARINNAATYNKYLSGITDVIAPAVPKNSRHAFNYYTIRIKNRRGPAEKKLKDNGIASAIYYPLSLHLQQVYRDLGYKKGDFPVCEEAQDEVLSLPMYPELQEPQIQKISALIKTGS